MISDENRTFDANLVAGDGRNHRKSKTATMIILVQFRAFPAKTSKTKVTSVLGGRRRSSGDRLHAGWWPESEESKGGRKWPNRKREVGGEEREKLGKFPKMETYHSNSAIYRKWLWTVTVNSNFNLSLITFAYELRFLRTTYARARFNVLYNFHEEHFLKFWPEQKVNF